MQLLQRHRQAWILSMQLVRRRRAAAQLESAVRAVHGGAASRRGRAEEKQVTSNCRPRKILPTSPQSNYL